MSPVDAAVIRRKLGHIVTALERLAPIARFTPDEYRARFYERKAAERLVQEAIEAALDINAHLIAELTADVPEESHAGFLRMGELDIISVELARSLEPSAGLPNRLVHEYDEIDDTKVLEAIATLRQLYPRYVQSVEAYLTRTGA